MAKELKNQNDMVTSIVSPEFITENKNSQSPSNSNSQFRAMMLAQSMGANSIDLASVNFADFGLMLNNKYKRPLIVGFHNSFVDLIAKKGFRWKGPYDYYDDMAYSDKKGCYLALLPKMNIYIQKGGKSVERYAMTQVVTETGQITVSGEMLLSFVEPMTKERIMSKRINLADFNICKEYIVQRKIGSKGMVFDAIASGSELRDNTDKVLAEAINEFYTKAMGKIYRMVSAEEILSYQTTIEELKGLKRF